VKIIGQPHVENQKRHGDAEDAIAEGVEAGLGEHGDSLVTFGAFMQKTLSFFNACRGCSIDFCQFAPMFRLDAARHRSAMP
jgi:hypothetical protein